MNSKRARDTQLGNQAFYCNMIEDVLITESFDALTQDMQPIAIEAHKQRMAGDEQAKSDAAWLRYYSRR